MKIVPLPAHARKSSNRGPGRASSCPTVRVVEDGAVDDHEWFARPARHSVEGPSHDFFARSRLPDDEQRNRGLGDPVNLFDHAAERGRLANETGPVRHRRHMVQGPECHQVRRAGRIRQRPRHDPRQAVDAGSPVDVDGPAERQPEVGGAEGTVVTRALSVGEMAYLETETPDGRSRSAALKTNLRLA